LLKSVLFKEEVVRGVKASIEITLGFGLMYESLGDEGIA